MVDIHALLNSANIAVMCMLMHMRLVYLFSYINRYVVSIPK